MGFKFFFFKFTLGGGIWSSSQGEKKLLFGAGALQTLTTSILTECMPCWEAHEKGRDRKSREKATYKEKTEAPYEK